MVTMFSEYCSVPFIIEPVIVQYPDGKIEKSPSIKYWEESVSPDYIQKQIGLPKEVKPQEMASLLSRMGLVSRFVDDKIISEVPPTRHDILHACDIMEDVAVAYDFNPPTSLVVFFTIWAVVKLRKVRIKNAKMSTVSDSSSLR